MKCFVFDMMGVFGLWLLYCFYVSDVCVNGFVEWVDMYMMVIGGVLIFDVSLWFMLMFDYDYGC